MEKISVQEFINKFNSINNPDELMSFVDSVIVNTYIPFEEKITMCQRVINATCYDKKDNQHKLFFNSPAKYMYFYLSLVKEYTNIQINFKNGIDEFNLLNQNESLDVIISLINEREFNECKLVMDLVEEDLLKNEYELRSVLLTEIEKFSEIIKNLMPASK